MSEWSVNISLVSDVEAAFTSGDNSGIVATDTCKNTVSTNLAVCSAAAWVVTDTKTGMECACL